MMRFHILLITALFFQNGITNAQNLEITVLNKNSIPMPYAYILLNNKPIAVSDTIGMAIIPQSNLVLNDTISVSYLGAAPTWIIYDQSLKNTKKHCFYLDESGFMLNEAVVTYQNIEKLFKKSFKDVPLLNYNCKMTASFDAKFTFKTKTNHPITGTFEATNERYLPRFWNWFDPPVKIYTKSDTTGLRLFLNYYTHEVLNLCNLSIWIWQSKSKTKAKPFYSYLGEKDSFKVFRFSYPQSFIKDYYYQIILYLDKDSKYLNHVEVDALNNQSDNKYFGSKINLTFDCEVFNHSNSKMKTIYLPVNIHYTTQQINNNNVDFKITNISIK